MKMTEVKAGETYWFSTNDRDWDQYGGRSTTQYPVHIATLTRYDYRVPATQRRGDTVDTWATEAPRGLFLRGVVPGDRRSGFIADRDDRVVYVMPRNLRLPLAKAEALIALNTAKRHAALEVERDQAALTRALAEALTRRAVGAGLVTGATGFVIEPLRGAGLRVTVARHEFERLLARLEAEAEHHDESYRAGYADGDEARRDMALRQIEIGR